MVWGEGEHKRKEGGGGEPIKEGGEEPTAVWGEGEHKRKEEGGGGPAMGGGEELAMV